MNGRFLQLSLVIVGLAVGVLPLSAQNPAPPQPPVAPSPPAPLQPAMAPQQPAPPVAPPQPVPPPAPAVGDVAPDFTAPYADSAGAGAAPIALQALRGKVVVVAFYPKDRTGGCTAELTKFRDEHASLFGSDVVVLPMSLDDVASHESWAKEMRFPFPLLSDAGGQIAARYGSITPGRSTSNRTVFVIGRDGRIRYRELRFGALDQHAYDALAAAVKEARSE